MWIFTKHGFFSVVCARQGDGKRGQPLEPTRLMVRARLRSHLEALQARWPDDLGERDIQTFAGTDYAYRMFVDKHTWARILAELALETDYDNFKSAVGRSQDPSGRSYEKALHDVWSVMYRVQRGSRV